MGDVQANAIETTFDHKFARDLIRFVLRDYMTGLNWIPTGIFEETDLDSPFTPQFRDALKEELDNDGHVLHTIFDDCFPDKSLVEDIYFENCREAKNRFVAEEFHIGSFISFSALMAYFAGLSYHYGAKSSPFITYKMIIKAIRELKTLEKVDDNLWNEIQTWLENQISPLRLWESSNA